MLLLDNPTNLIMSAGGDDRITVDEQSGLNSYGCKPYPENVIAYASSTANTISASAYALVEARHHTLLSQTEKQSIEQVYLKAFSQIRMRLGKAYQLPNDVDLVFGASGTDMEIAVLSLALLSPENQVHNILVAPDEVGSGTEYAIKGQYFAEKTALGYSVTKGENIEGFDRSDISTGFVEVRDEQGLPRESQAIADDIRQQIGNSIKDSVRPIIHLVHRSKTGLMAPGWNEFHSFVEQWGDSIDIVVDACQGRISPESVRDYVSHGAMVVLTGSKFIGGAPFSGVLLVPDHVSERVIKGKSLPIGLGAFFSRAEWPEHWEIANSILTNATNFGLVLRWESALYELERLMSLPEDRLLMTIDRFNRAVHDMTNKSEVLKIIDSERLKEKRSDLCHPFERNMIITLSLQGFGSGQRKDIDLDDARVIHQGLYSNLEHFVTAEQSELAKLNVHLGQPVKCSRLTDGCWQGTLRIALGAPLISDIAMLDEELIGNRFESDMDRILKKYELVLKLFDQL